MGVFRRRFPAAARKPPPNSNTTSYSTPSTNAKDKDNNKNNNNNNKSNNNNPPRRRRRQAPIRINPLLRLVPLLLMYLAWTSYTLSKTPEWKTRVWRALERELGWKGTDSGIVGSGPNEIGGRNDKDNTNGGGDGDDDDEDEDGGDSFGAWTPPDREIPAIESAGASASEGIAAVGSNHNHHHRRHRIPCGLMIRNDNDDGEEDADMLPLATLAVSEPGKVFSSEEENEPSSPSHPDPALARSTLHARALERYPQLERLVVVVPNDEQSKNTTATRMIPKGAFRLRMGSEESTIEDSPPLWIIEEGQQRDCGKRESGSNTASNEDEAVDLVLGNDFWKHHKAAFESDEIYLFQNSCSEGSEESSSLSKESRVMVPYLSMRSRPSFGT